MKCRPRAPNRLLCLILNSTYTDFSSHTLLQHHSHTSHSFYNCTVPTVDNCTFSFLIQTKMLSFPSFEIKYNKHGVENLLINSISSDFPLRKLDIIKRIADQLNPGINLKGSRDASHFEGVEHTSMGNCTTKYKITREEESETKLIKEDTDFKLFTLPMTDIEPGTTISIKKYRTRCFNVPRRMYSSVLKMVCEYCTYLCIFNLFV